MNRDNWSPCGEEDGRLADAEAACQFACEHDCTLVGHAYESIRFLNQCLHHGIVKSAVEEDPRYRDLNIEITRMQFHLLRRLGK